MNFSLGEKTAAELGLVLLGPGTIIPAAPPTRDRTLHLPGRPGELDFGAEAAPRNLTLHCATLTATRPEHAECIRQLAAHLHGPDGRPRALRLLLEPETDRYYTVRYSGSLPWERWASWGQVVIALVAYDPFAYAVSPDLVTLTASPHTHQQRGSAPAEPLLRLQGVSTGAGGQQLSIGIGAQAVIYRGALASGEWLEIDGAAKTATRVSGLTRTSVLPQLYKPVFPPLVPGANTITVTAAGGAAWSLLEVHCRNRWL